MDSKERCNGGNRSLSGAELGVFHRGPGIFHRGPGISENAAAHKYYYETTWVMKCGYAYGDLQDARHGMKGLNLNLGMLDALISWKLDRYSATKKAVGEGKMQDQITIECQMDFTDKDKMQEVIKLACSMARTLAANIQLLDPVCKPQCVVYTDNFMSPPEKINIYQDLIGKGNEELQETAGISSELLSAVTGENQ